MKIKITFNKLVTREDWEDALAKIIVFARQAVSDKNEDELSDATDLLNDFIRLAPPTSWAGDLDRHAGEGLAQLVFDIATITDDDLATRTEELRKIGKSIQITAANNEQAAADIRHDKLVQALTSAMNAAKAVKDLQTAVKDNVEHDKITDAAQSLLDAISKFKDVMSQSDSEN